MGKQAYNGIGARQVTMEAGTALASTFDMLIANGTPNIDKAVKISGNGQVLLVASGDEIFGQLKNLADDGMCAVQEDGYCILPVDPANSAITYGSGLVGGATAGTVKTGTSRTCIAIASAGTLLVVCKFI